MPTRKVSTPALLVFTAGLAAALGVLVALRHDREARAHPVPALLALPQAGVLEAAALAQPAAAAPASRPRGQYTLFSGRVLGSNINAIYILDTTNQELVGVKWDKAARRLAGIGYRNLVSDSDAAGKGSGR